MEKTSTATISRGVEGKAGPHLHSYLKRVYIWTGSWYSQICSAGLSKVKSSIWFGFHARLLIFVLNSQYNYTPPSVLQVDRLGLFMARSEPLCLFPIYRARTVYEHQIFWAHTLNRQLQKHEEQFAECEKVYWIRIADANQIKSNFICMAHFIQGGNTMRLTVGKKGGRGFTNTCKKHTDFLEIDKQEIK